MVSIHIQVIPSSLYFAQLKNQNVERFCRLEFWFFFLRKRTGKNKFLIILHKIMGGTFLIYAFY